MSVATLDGRGRITIPKEIRDRLGLKAGVRLHLVVIGGRLVALPQNVPLRSLYGILPKPPRPITVEEMDEAIRRRVVERFLRATRA